MYVELKGKLKWVVFVPILLFLILQNKRVINLSLAYDIAFRQSYYYNRISYPKEMGNLVVNSLKINSNSKADIYLNCSSGGMTYYVVSPFNKLPVINIDQGAYENMTNDKDYKDKVWKQLTQYLGSKKEISFVTIAAKAGLNTEYISCINNLKIKGWLVDEEKDVSFLDYKPQALVVIWGHFGREYFDKIGE
jgi:hypothetical protein